MFSHSAFNKGTINISQANILPRLRSYLLRQKKTLAQQDYNQDDFQYLLDELERGYCLSIGFVAAYSLWLERQPKRTDENGNEIARDDWSWLSRFLESLVTWNKKSLQSLPLCVSKDIDRFIQLIELFQNPSNYELAHEEELDLTFSDTKGRGLTKVFSVCGCFKPDDWMQQVTVECDGIKQETNLLEILAQDNNVIVSILSHNHALYMLCCEETITIVDANMPRLFQEFKRDNVQKILDAICSACNYDQSPSPFSIKVYSFDVKTKAYPNPYALLTAIKPAFKPKKGYADDMTALILSVISRCDESVQYFCEQGGIDLITARGQTALHCAVNVDDPDQIQRLLRYGANPNLVDQQENSACMRALKEGSEKCAAVLLAAEDIDLTLQNEEGNTALHLAIEYNLPSMVRDISGRKIVNEVINKDFETPLILACNLQDIEHVKILLAQHVSVDVLPEGKMNALMHAARVGDLEICQELIKHNANVNMATQYGTSALAVAIQYDRADVVALLLAAGAKMLPFVSKPQLLIELIQDETQEHKLRDLFKHHQVKQDGKIEGVLPIHLAVIIGNGEIIRQLLAAGADMHEAMPCGIAAYELAQSNEVSMQVLNEWIDSQSTNRLCANI